MRRSFKLRGRDGYSPRKDDRPRRSGLDVDQDNEFKCGSGYGRHGHGKDCNDVDVDLDTGKNDANDNTHFDGDPEITTGDANSDVDVSNEANVNKVGNVDLDGSDISIEIDLDGLLALLLGLLD